MTTFAVATVYGDTDTFVMVQPQPRSDGIFTAGDDIYSGAGPVYEDGYLYTEWVFRGSALDEVDYSAVLAQLGLTSAKSAAVTIRTVDNDRNWVARNAIAVRPQSLAWTATGWRDTTIRFIWLEELP